MATNTFAWLKARRFISASRVKPNDWNQMRKGALGYLGYNIMDDSFTHFVVVADDDERAETVQIFDPFIPFNPESF